MHLCQFFYSFTFYNDTAFAQEIHTILRFQLFPMITGMETVFTKEFNALLLQFHLKSFLIAIFTEAWSKFCMNFMYGAYHIIHMRLQFINVNHLSFFV